MEYAEAVEEALCFGWIDSKAMTLDADRTMQCFSPRRPGSGWSGLNKKRVAKLIEAGQMTPAGLVKIEAAKQDGSWNALDAIETLEKSQDLERALAAYDDAARYFDAFPPSVQRGILAWIANAKRAETRAKRIEETARLAAENIRANQGRG